MVRFPVEQFFLKGGGVGVCFNAAKAVHLNAKVRKTFIENDSMNCDLLSK